jgi:hypothetical protein
MKRLLAVVVAAVALSAAMTARAQEGDKPPPEGGAEELPKPQPVPDTPGIAAPGCPNVKILWYERMKVVPLLTPREEIVFEKYKTLDVVYKEEKKTVTDVVMKSRQVEELRPCTTMVPVQVTDPVTGHCSTVMEPHTEMKPRTVTIWYAEPTKREVAVMVPYVKEVEDLMPTRTILLEYTADVQRHGGAIKIESGEIKKPLYLHLPPEHCPPPH